MKKYIKNGTGLNTGWSARRNPDLGRQYVLSNPAGTAYVTEFDDREGVWGYTALVKLRRDKTKDYRESFYYDGSLDDAMSWAEDLLYNELFNKPIEASTTTIEKSKSDCQWMKGLWWDIDGHTHTITGVNGYPLLSCEVTEDWISEDTYKPVKHKSWYRIKEDEKGHIYLESKKYPEFKLYLNSAINYMDLVPSEFDELDFLRDDYQSDSDDEYDEEDDYTPSATRGDYSPSSPWNAPGMSIHDFI